MSVTVVHCGTRPVSLALSANGNGEVSVPSAKERQPTMADDVVSGLG